MRRCLLVLAAAAAFDESLFDPTPRARGLEHACAYGPPPAKAAVALPLLHEPRVKLWWPALDDVVEIAQDSSEPYDAPTTLWPAGAVLAHALASDCASWKDRVVLELGCGVGAPALALARCGASVVATDISEAALALAAENTNVTAENTNGTVVTRRLDWDDDDALREVLAEGPFFAVVGAKNSAGRSAASTPSSACWTRPWSSSRTAAADDDVDLLAAVAAFEDWPSSARRPRPRHTHGILETSSACWARRTSVDLPLADTPGPTATPFRRLARGTPPRAPGARRRAH